MKLFKNNKYETAETLTVPQQAIEPQPAKIDPKIVPEPPKFEQPEEQAVDQQDNVLVTIDNNIRLLNHNMLYMSNQLDRIEDMIAVLGNKLLKLQDDFNSAMQEEEEKSAKKK